LWAPVLLTRWAEFHRDVLNYRGGRPIQWGPAQFLEWLHAPEVMLDLLVSPGRFLILLLSAVLPAYLLWRGRLGPIPAGGLTLVLFLLLSPAFGMQYLAWALAAAYLVNIWAATAYAAAASIFTTVVYDHWNGAYPWNWTIGQATTQRPKDLALMVITWSALSVVAASGIGRRQPLRGCGDGRGSRPRFTDRSARAVGEPRLDELTLDHYRGGAGQ
jgi:hypothetical protein